MSSESPDPVELARFEQTRGAERGIYGFRHYTVESAPGGGEWVVVAHFDAGGQPYRPREDDGLDAFFREPPDSSEVVGPAADLDEARCLIARQERP